MNGRVARKLRKESGDAPPRKYFVNGRRVGDPWYCTGYHSTLHADTKRKIYQQLKKNYVASRKTNC